MKMLGPVRSAQISLIAFLVVLILSGCGSDRRPGIVHVSAATNSLAAGGTAQLVAIDVNSRGASSDVTRTATWSSSDPQIATVSTQGLVTARRTGSAVIAAAFASDTGSFAVAVSAPPVVGLALSPRNAALLTHGSQQYLATATYGNQTTGTVYNGITWSVTPSSVATIGADGMLTAVGSGTFAVTGTIGSLTEAVTGSVSNAPLSSISVAPATATVASGATLQFTATGHYADGSTQNLTPSVGWSTSNAALLTINASGVATAQSVTATATVSVAAQLAGLSGTAQVSVTPPVQAPLALVALVVTPTSSSVAMHTGTQLTATGYFADGSQEDVSSLVTWTSDDQAISVVDGAGLLHAGGPGASTIHAQIAVAPQTASLAQGGRRLGPRITPGRVGHGPTAADADPAATTLQSQSTSLVTAATLVALIASSDGLGAQPYSVPVGATQPLSLSGIFSDGTKQDLTALATWQSSAPSVAGVSPQGVATAFGPGSVQFTASFAGQSATTPPLLISDATLQNISLSLPTQTLQPGIPLPLALTGEYSDGSIQDLTGQASFQSSDPSTVMVNAGGLVVGLKAGQATITGSAQGQSTTLNVAVDPVTLQSLIITPPTPLNFAVGTTQRFRVLGTFSNGSSNDETDVAVWQSSSPDVLTIGSDGVAHGNSPGSATISVSLLGITQQTATVRVTAATLVGLVVSPATIQLAPQTQQQFSAVGIFSDGTTEDLRDDVQWSGSDGGVLAVDGDGLATGVSPGAAQVVATMAGQRATTSLVTVSNATLTSTDLSPLNPTIAVATNEQLFLTGTFSDGTFQDLTGCAQWTTSAPDIVYVNSSGLVNGTSPGVATVKATCGSDSVYTTVTVANKTLSSVAIAPGVAEIAVGDAVPFELVGTFSDGTTENINESVTWSSSNHPVGTLAGERAIVDGNVIGVSPGTSIISALFRNFPAATAVLHVAPKPVASLLVTPANASLLAGATQQFTATAVYTDQTGGDLSSLVSWSSSNPALLSVDASGLVTAQASTAGGVATVTATFGAVSSSVTVQVQAPVAAQLLSLTVVPTSSRIAVGTPQQLVAMGSYSDGTQQDLSGIVTWSCLSPTLATVDAHGLVTGIAAGTATVQAQLGGSRGSSTIIVDTVTLVSVALSPSGANFADGTTQQFHLIGTFSDGRTQDLSPAATWQSSSPSSAAVSSRGLVTGTGAGSVQISAAFHGLTASTAPLQVTGATLVSLIVQPSSPTYAAGTSQQFKVIGFFSDGTTQDLTGSAVFQSSNPGVVAVSPTGIGQGLAAGSAQVTVSALGQTVTTAPVQVTAATLTAITLAPASPSLSAGASLNLTATGTFSDGTTRDLTSQVVWASSNPQAATVDQFGVARGGAPGPAQFSATLDGVTATTSPTQVSAPVLVSLALNPASAQIALGSTQQFSLTGTFADGSTHDVSGLATWTSSAPGVATISASGLATGIAVGAVQFTAVYGGGATTSSTVQVTPARLVSLAITPATPTALAKGATEQFTARATFSDGTAQDVTSSATWSTTAPSIATISAYGLATGVGVGQVQIHAAYQGQTATTPSFQATAAALASLVVKATSARIAAGTGIQFDAIGTYTDGTVHDLTCVVTWNSGNQGVATINASGLAMALVPGVVQIQAQSASFAGQATLVVTSATLLSVALSPSSATLPDGSPQQFQLTGTFSDDSHQNLSSLATWTSSAPSVASISSTGLATGLAAGSVQFTGSYGGQTASTSSVQVTAATLVSVAITPSAPSFAAGTSQQFHVTGTYSDGSTADLTGEAIFSSSNPSVLQVSAAGQAQGIASGMGTVSAVVNGLSATTGSVTVSPAKLVSIAVSPNAPSFANGTSQQFTAVGTFSDGTTEDLTSQVTWSSTLPQVATINTAGTASAGGRGSTQITASLDGVSTTTGTVQVTPATVISLSVSPTSAQIAKGTTQQFTATGTFTDGTTQNLTSTVSWTSSDGLIVSVNAGGLATGTGAGSAQLYATYGGQTASTSSFQVTPATLVSVAFNPSHPYVAAGTSAQVTVTGTFSDGSTQDLTSSATYSSSNPSAVSVSATGVVTGAAPGTATITVQAAGTTNTFPATATSATLTSITISPSNPASLAKGTTQQFTATGHFSDGSTQNLSSSVSWGSTNTGVVTIDGSGLATGAGVGSAQVSATYQGQSASTASFQVTPATVTAVAVSPSSASIQTGASQQFTAMATYTDGTTQSVSSSATWSSSNPAAATVSSTGLAGGVAAGSTTITAQLGTVSGTAGLAVTAATPPPVTLQSIAVSPSTASIAQGGTQQYTATGSYSDGSTQNLTTTVTWHSSSNSIATINTQGLATGAGGGSATISASYSGQTGSATLTVSPATLTSIAVTPSSASIANGTTQQYHATGTFSDGSTQNLTTAVSWSSTGTSVATINSSGLATGAGIGSTTIRAQSGSVSATASLVVTAATATSLQISPSSVSLPAGDTQQLMVTATFSDGSSQDVTASATYATTHSHIASVSSGGLLTAGGQGSASVTVSLGSASATLPVTVTSAVLTSIAITPSSLSLAAGTSQQLTATGTFSDGSTSNLTNTAGWTSSAASIATVSSAGDVTVSQTGNATITATSGSVSASISVTGTSAVITSIAVSPGSATLAAGQTQQFTAIATLSDGTQQTITNSTHWSVSDASKATVSNSSGSNGLLTSSNAGSITVMATSNSVVGSAPVTIQAAALSSIHLTPNPVSLPAGTSQSLTATGTYTDGSTANLTSTATWSSSSLSTASVNASGVVHGVSPGSATVTAAVGSVSGTDAITVTNAVLTSIAITPSSPSIALGLTTQLTATGTYSDGSTANISSQVQWSSSSPATATVSTTGLVSTVATGSTNVTATSGSITQTVPVQVTAAVLVSIAVQSSTASFPLGLNLQLQAIGTYSDGTTQNLTSSVTWSSQTPSIGVVSTSGLASGVTTGIFNATATKSGITGSEAVTVTAAVLQSITITPANSIIVKINGNVQFTATGHYSDGSTQDITTSVHWAITSGIGLGTVSQSGVFSPIGVGVGGVIEATLGSISGQTGFTVVAV